eukprot:711732_1
MGEADDTDSVTSFNSDDTTDIDDKVSVRARKKQPVKSAREQLEQSQKRCHERAKSKILFEQDSLAARILTILDPERTGRIQVPTLYQFMFAFIERFGTTKSGFSTPEPSQSESAIGPRHSHTRSSLKIRTSLSPNLKKKRAFRPASMFPGSSSSISFPSDSMERKSTIPQRKSKNSIPQFESKLTVNQVRKLIDTSLANPVKIQDVFAPGEVYSPTLKVEKASDSPKIAPSVFEEKYAKIKAMQRKREMKIKYDRAKQLEREMQECTFRPEVTHSEYAKQRISKIKEELGTNDHFSVLYADGKKKLERQNLIKYQAKMEEDMQFIKTHPFEPQLRSDAASLDSVPFVPEPPGFRKSVARMTQKRVESEQPDLEAEYSRMRYEMHREDLTNARHLKEREMVQMRKQADVKPVFHVDINLNEFKSDRISYYRGDDVYILVRRFARKHHLGVEPTRRLHAQLTEHIKMHDEQQRAHAREKIRRAKEELER